MSIRLPLRRFLYIVFIVAVVAGCSKKGSPPQEDDDTAYTDDSDASDDKAAALPSGLKKTKSDPAAKKIMQEVRDAYKHFSSYDDICEMDSRLRNAKSADNTGFADTTKVLTNFARPDCLRVEIQSLNRFNSNVGASFLWGNGKKTEQYNGASDGEMYQFFDTPEAIAGNWATLLATSGEFNPIVPLLLPDKLKKVGGGKPFFDKLRILKLEGEEKVDGTMCHRIEATIDPEDIKNQLNTNVSLFTAAEANRIESKATIWVDKNSKLVRKIHHYMLSQESITKDPDFGTVKIPGLRIDLKYTYKSRLNRPQSWSDLAFGEPNASEEQPVSAAAVADATFKKTKKSRDEAQSTQEHCWMHRSPPTANARPMRIRARSFSSRSTAATPTCRRFSLQPFTSAAADFVLGINSRTRKAIR
ncbi:MAG: hypothetical protein IPK83_13675 [Planctomycetes bacterium]|nr:hypothetical protein [Planctomycetota bacterium]